MSSCIGGDYDPDYDDEGDEDDFDDPLFYPDGEGGWIDIRYDYGDDEVTGYEEENEL